MNSDETHSANTRPEDLAAHPALERFDKLKQCCRNHPDLTLLLVVLVGLAVLSPLFVLTFKSLGEAKEYSELVKNVVESCAVLAAIVALFKWVTERTDRATDVLLKLEEKFAHEKVQEGCRLIEVWPELERNDKGRNAQLDYALRFYVILYGVRLAHQVPDRSLSVCFRFWPAHFFRKDRKEFRDYVTEYYPTLTSWLMDDARRGFPFFSPNRFFPGNVDWAYVDSECKLEE